MSINQHSQVSVIGAGIGGLAIAIRLAIKGYKVTIFESNSYVGGKLSQIESDGFRFDAGPSLFTMPELVDELFVLAGLNPKTYFNYQKLDESCRYFYEDGTVLKAYSDIQKLAKESYQKTGLQPNQLIKHLKKSKYIFDATAFLFLQKSLHKFKSYISFTVLKSFLKLPFLGIFKSMHKANHEALNNPKMEQLFNRYATYNGSNPFLAPAILNIIPHLEFGKGAYFPTNGMYSIALSLYQLAKKLGVTFRLNSQVQEIVVQRGQVEGLRLSNEFIKSDYVVSNIDVYFVYKKLLKSFSMPKKIVSQERSTSALIFYWGISKTFSQLDLHNIFFSKDYKTEFDCLRSRQSIHFDPTVYINITSKKNSSDAPKGCENWFVMINVPPNNGQNWDLLIPQARAAILKKLNRILEVNLEENILNEEILDPIKIESKTASYQGSLYGTASNNKMAAFFRHSNFSNKVSKLYFCGGSVHPGGGIPLALSSAKIVDGFFKSLN